MPTLSGFGFPGLSICYMIRPGVKISQFFRSNFWGGLFRTQAFHRIGPCRPDGLVAHREQGDADGQ